LVGIQEVAPGYKKFEALPWMYLKTLKALVHICLHKMIQSKQKYTHVSRMLCLDAKLVVDGGNKW